MSYSYGFELYWEELPEKLREHKIDQYIAYLKSTGDPRERIEKTIEAHFPMYF